MELRARIRPLSRRAVWMTALAALIASAVAGAVAPSAQAAKKRAPVITGVSPMNVAVAQVLTVRGRNFVAGRYKNTLVFKRDGARAVFVKAEIATRKLLRVTVPKKITDTMAVKDGAPIPTKFSLRVLARKFGKRFTGARLSPMVGPELPPVPPKPVVDPDGDCDSDGQLNKVDADDDNDLLADTTEVGMRYPLDPCQSDSDGDGVADGYEYQSAIDLNEDEYQEPQSILPVPQKRPYPNPLFADGNVDYDGDSLRLSQEFSLWKAYRNPAAGLNDLVYSDGNQYSAYGRSADGRRPGGLVGPDPNVKYDEFFAWAGAAAYGSVWIRGNVFALRDMNHDGVVEPGRPFPYGFSEERYFDFDLDGKLSDDERDEDADGLTNYDEATGRLTSGYWAGCYKKEKPYPITYAGTDLVDGDSDGDGVRDGADDQDHDDVPNVMELSRNAASGRAVVVGCDDKGAVADPAPLNGAVNPYNPCLPYVDSRTCERHPSLDQPYFPFDPQTPFYNVLN